MADQYLMERFGERMNVTPDKLAEYLADGWKILKAPADNKNVVVKDQPVVEIPDAPVVPNVQAEDPKGQSVEEVVEKIGKRSRGKKV
jgi:hypothetical protein